MGEIMKSKTTLNLMVFVINVLFLTVMALFAIWGFFFGLLYLLWLSVGIISAFWFAFYFRKFTNQKEFIYKSLLHGAFTYAALIVFVVIQAIITHIF
jgi:hypothetical protein